MLGIERQSLRRRALKAIGPTGLTSSSSGVQPVRPTFYSQVAVVSNWRQTSVSGPPTPWSVAAPPCSSSCHPSEGWILLLVPNTQRVDQRSPSDRRAPTLLPRSDGVFEIRGPHDWAVASCWSVSVGAPYPGLDATERPPRSSTSSSAPDWTRLSAGLPGGGHAIEDIHHVTNVPVYLGVRRWGGVVGPGRCPAFADSPSQ